MQVLKLILTLINLFLFGIGSFLCFILAVTSGVDRLLIGGVFLLLFTFVNQKIITKVFSNYD